MTTSTLTYVYQTDDVDAVANAVVLFPWLAAGVLRKQPPHEATRFIIRRWIIEANPHDADSVLAYLDSSGEWTVVAVDLVADGYVANTPPPES